MGEERELRRTNCEGRNGDGERGDGETRRQGDKETRRQGDKETGRQGDGETRRRGDKETGRQGQIAFRIILWAEITPLRLWCEEPGDRKQVRRILPIKVNQSA
jgi:hypothetical protein